MKGLGLDEVREDGQFQEDDRPLFHPLDCVDRGNAVPPRPAAAAAKDAQVAGIPGRNGGLLGDVVEGDHPLPRPPPLGGVGDTGKNNILAAVDPIPPAKPKRVYDMSHLRRSITSSEGTLRPAPRPPSRGANGANGAKGASSPRPRH